MVYHLDVHFKMHADHRSAFLFLFCSLSDWMVKNGVEFRIFIISANPRSFDVMQKEKWNCQVPGAFYACSNHFFYPLHLSPLIPLSIHKSHAKTRYIRKSINHKMFVNTKRANTIHKCHLHYTLTSFRSKR